MIKSLQVALKAVDAKKAVDIVILDISKVASFASYFLLSTGESMRQIQAIADEVEEQLKKHGYRPSHIEGYRNAEWILMDYIDLVIHVFSRKARAHYDLERLWRDGTRLEPAEVLKSKVRRGPLRKSRARAVPRTRSTRAAARP